MHAFGDKTISGGDRGQHRSEFFERYIHRCATVVTNQMLMIRCLREVVDPGAVTQVDVMEIAEFLQYIKRAIDG